MRWSCLRFNVLLLPESYRRLPAGLLVSCYGKAPSMPKTELKHTERGTQHCNNGRPTPVCDLYRPSLKYSVSHSSSMKGPRLNFHAERELAHPNATNCQLCGKKSSRNSRRCRKHGRTSPYTAAGDFPVLP